MYVGRTFTFLTNPCRHVLQEMLMIIYFFIIIINVKYKKSSITVGRIFIMTFPVSLIERVAGEARE